MAIRITTKNEKAIIFIDGCLDIFMCRSFKEAYNQQLQLPWVKCLEIDMSGIDRFDSSSLGMLLMVREQAIKLEKSLLLSNPNKMVLEIIEIANFHRLFVII